MPFQELPTVCRMPFHVLPTVCRMPFHVLPTVCRMPFHELPTAECLSRNYRLFAECLSMHYRLFAACISQIQSAVSSQHAFTRITNCSQLAFRRANFFTIMLSHGHKDFSQYAFFSELFTASHPLNHSRANRAVGAKPDPTTSHPAPLPQNPAFD